VSYAFTEAALGEADTGWLAALPDDLRFEHEGARVLLAHGSPRKINEYLLPDRDERTFLRLAEAEKDDVLAFGHTHQPWQRTYGGVLFVNVGSVGRPKDGDPRAMYTVLEAVSGRTAEAEPERVKSPRVEHVRVAYDVNAVARTVLEAGLPAALAAAIRTGT
jgi:putative phosphoesterase